jgi:2'-5' RNA ligase
MLYLGEVNARELPAVSAAVAQACTGHAPFTMTVAGVGCFPNPRRPRTLWSGIGAGAAELVALHAALEPPLLDLGCYRREERQFTPHVTLGRRKSERDAETLARALAKQAQWQGGSSTVSELLVLSSELTRDGPRYSVLSRAKLQG